MYLNFKIGLLNDERGGFNQLAGQNIQPWRNMEFCVSFHTNP